MKKISSILLSAVLLLSSLSIATMDVHAEEAQPAETVVTEAAEEALAPVKVSVTLGSGYNTYTASFTVPVGKTLQVSYEFVKDENGLPVGYQMRLNGEAPTYHSGAASGLANLTWQGGSVVDGITVGSVTGGGVPTNMALYTDGKPSEVVSYTATPSDAGSNKRFSIPTVNVTNAVGEANLQFDVVYVDHDTNEVIGRYSEDRLTKKGTKSAATAKYGIQEITMERGNGRSPYTNFFASNEKYNGYGLYRGKIGAVDLQKFHCVVGEDGVHIVEEERKYQGDDRIAICYLEVNHEKVERHTQPVRYMDGDQVVLEQRQPLLGYYQFGSVDGIQLDMTGVEEALEKLGYRLAENQEYSVICNGNNGRPHDPEISTFTVLPIPKEEPKQPESMPNTQIPAAVTPNPQAALVPQPVVAPIAVVAPQAAPQAAPMVTAAAPQRRTVATETSVTNTDEEQETEEPTEEKATEQVVENETPMADVTVASEDTEAKQASLVFVFILIALAVIAGAIGLYVVKHKHQEV